jgi:hypothetical protein
VPEYPAQEVPAQDNLVPFLNRTEELRMLRERLAGTVS